LGVDALYSTARSALRCTAGLDGFDVLDPGELIDSDLDTKLKKTQAVCEAPRPRGSAAGPRRAPCWLLHWRTGRESLAWADGI